MIETRIPDDIVILRMMTLNAPTIFIARQIMPKVGVRIFDRKK